MSRTDAEINNDIKTDIAYDTEESENVDSRKLKPSLKGRGEDDEGRNLRG